MTNLSDVELMQRIGQRDQQALATLYDRYNSPAYSLAYRVLNKKELAEEVIQDIFLSIWNRPEAWDPARGKLLNWLLTVTRRRAIDRLRRELRGVDVMDVAVEDVSHRVTHTNTVDDPAWADGQLLRELIARLPPEQASLIELAYFKGMTQRDIARSTRVPLGTVKSRLRAGLQALRGLWLGATTDASRDVREQNRRE